MNNHRLPAKNESSNISNRGGKVGHYQIYLKSCAVFLTGFVQLRRENQFLLHGSGKVLRLNLLFEPPCNWLQLISMSHA